MEDKYTISMYKGGGTQRHIRENYFSSVSHVGVRCDNS